MNRVFVCYARADNEFVDRLESALDMHGIRVWRDIHDAEAGPLSSILERAIFQNPVVMVILSERSVSSGWVKWEIGKALELEVKLGRSVLCPVALDGSWKTKLPAPLLAQIKDYNVLDMSGPGGFEKSLSRLLSGLWTHYDWSDPKGQATQRDSMILARLGEGAESWNRSRIEDFGEWVSLRGLDLSGLNLGGFDLQRADLTRVNLAGANLAGAVFGTTSFVEVDLSNSNGLVTALHRAPSNIGTSTFRKSRGKVPDIFLKGCGLAEWEISSARLYDPDLTEAERIEIHYRVIQLQSMAPIQANPIFISYTHADSLFVDRLQAALDERSIRSWRDVHDAEAGPLDKIIDRAISLNPTMLLVLSKHSAQSEWVQWEIEKANKLSKKQGRHVLCPVARDDAWKTELPVRERKAVERYNVLPIPDDAVEEMMPRLLKGLRIHYRGEAPGE